jgi:modification methylase
MSPRERDGPLHKLVACAFCEDLGMDVPAPGAVAQGSGACNSWTFWHIETDKVCA